MGLTSIFSANGAFYTSLGRKAKDTPPPNNWRAEGPIYRLRSSKSDKVGPLALWIFSRADSWASQPRLV
jgi:hypothetical protein